MHQRLLWIHRAPRHKARAGALVLVLGLWGPLCLSSAVAADPPDVASARAVFQQVEQLRQAKRLRLSQQAGADTDAGEARCGCAPYGATTACTLGHDAQGVARWFEREGGSGDSLIRERLYFDGQGRLRFIFVHMGAVNGTVQEQRLYFSPAGQRVRASFKNVSGPGYTFPRQWPVQDELRRPSLPMAEGHCPR